MKEENVSDVPIPPHRETVEEWLALGNVITYLPPATYVEIKTIGILRKPKPKGRWSKR